MATAKAITVPFSMRHIEEAEEIVFDGGRAIRFVEHIKYAIGLMEVRRKGPDKAEIHIQVAPRYNTSAAEGMTVEVDRADFRGRFAELRDETIAKMNSVQSPRRAGKVPKA